MKIVLVSDIHSNYTALKSVIDKLEDIDYDKLVCLGDVIGYGPQPKKCLDLIKDKSDICIQGNHDRMASKENINPRLPERVIKGLEHTKNRLSDSDIKWLRDLPEKKEYKNLLFVHSHPVVTDEYVYPKNFSNMTTYMDGSDILCLGHTHVQHIENTESKVIMNPGSVGQPRDGNNKLGFAVVDNESMDVKQYRLEYDIDSVVEKVTNSTTLPDKNGKRLYSGK